MVNREIVRAAGVAGIGEVSEPLLTIARERFYKGDEIREGVSRLDLTDLLQRLYTIDEVARMVVRDLNRTSSLEERVQSLLPDLSDSDSELRAQVEAAAFAHAIEVESWSFGSQITLLRHGGPDADFDIPLPDGSDRALKSDQNPDDFTVLLMKLRGESVEDEVWRSFTEQYPKIEARIEGVREAIRKLSSDVGGYFSESEIAEIVMTREYPVHAPVEIRSPGDVIEDDGRITLTLSPWVSAEHVSTMWKQMQQEILGGRARAISNRNLSMTLFCLRRLREAWIAIAQNEEGLLEKPVPSGLLLWRDLMSEWNEANRDEFYEQASVMRKDFISTLTRVLNPFKSVINER